MSRWLFDAVAALLGLCDTASYEGGATVLLETAAGGQPDGEPLPYRLARRDELWVYDPSPTLAAVLAGGRVPELAARFHTTLAVVSVDLVTRPPGRAEPGVRAGGGRADRGAAPRHRLGGRGGDRRKRTHRHR
jgi:hydrogenase maturation protein HypF